MGGWVKAPSPRARPHPPIYPLRGFAARRPDGRGRRRLVAVSPSSHLSVKGLRSAKVRWERAKTPGGCAPSSHLSVKGLRSAKVRWERAKTPGGCVPPSCLSVMRCSRASTVLLGNGGRVACQDIAIYSSAAHNNIHDFRTPCSRNGIAALDQVHRPHKIVVWEIVVIGVGLCQL